jgi:PleD family two-component response regulator
MDVRAAAVRLLRPLRGEEFALVLPATDSAGAEQALRRIAAALPHSQTCSVGVAVWNGVETAATLVDRADRALYRAKALGRDRIELDAREPGPSPGPGRGLAAPAHA